MVISHLRACTRFVQTCFEKTQRQRIQTTDRGRLRRAGRPDMEVLPTDENNVRRAIRIEIGDAVRSYYGDLLKEGIPNRLTDLLRCLDETEKGAFESED